MRRPLLLVVIAALLVGACSSSDDADGPVAAPPSTTTSTTTTLPRPATETVEVFGDCPRRTSGSSPAEFDAQAGTYAAWLEGVDGLEVRFDVVQWLSGEDANEAYAAETGDTSGAPNDYDVRNESPAVRTAPLAEDARVLVLPNDGQAQLEDRSPADLAAHLGTSMQRNWWLTFEDGTVVEACQQYTP